MLSRDDILAHVDLGEEVEVPEWGGKVRVRGLTVAEWSDLQKATKDTDPVLAMADMVVRCTIDPAGVRMFADGDAPALAAKEAAVVVRLARIGQKRSGFEDGIEDAEKN
jgi:hypothetical protein